MWNYGAIKRHVSIAHLLLIAKWLDNDIKDEGRKKSWMIKSIERIDRKDEYVLELTDAGRGYTQKLKIENDQVIDLGIPMKWMS